jgi:hypothetical protein
VADLKEGKSKMGRGMKTTKIKKKWVYASITIKNSIV